MLLLSAIAIVLPTSLAVSCSPLSSSRSVLDGCQHLREHQVKGYGRVSPPRLSELIPRRPVGSRRPDLLSLAALVLRAARSSAQFCASASTRHSSPLRGRLRAQPHLKPVRAQFADHALSTSPAMHQRPSIPRPCYRVYFPQSRIRLCDLSRRFPELLIVGREPSRPSRIQVQVAPTPTRKPEHPMPGLTVACKPQTFHFHNARARKLVHRLFQRPLGWGQRPSDFVRCENRARGPFEHVARDALISSRRLY